MWNRTSLVHINATLVLTLVYIVQGEFPDQNTLEDGYAGVAPVDAFPAQNKFGKG